MPYDRSMRDDAMALVATSHPGVDIASVFLNDGSGFVAARASRLLGFMLTPSVRDGTARVRVFEHGAHEDRRESASMDAVCPGRASSSRPTTAASWR